MWGIMEHTLRGHVNVMEAYYFYKREVFITVAASFNCDKMIHSIILCFAVFSVAKAGTLFHFNIFYSVFLNMFDLNFIEVS